MGVKSITKRLNEAGVRARDDGHWGVGGMHEVLTRMTLIGRHRFNMFWKTRERKPDSEVVEMTVPPIIDTAEFEAVQALLKTHSPALTAARIVSCPIPRPRQGRRANGRASRRRWG
jgi:site-specific DNA recombinase